MLLTEREAKTKRCTPAIVLVTMDAERLNGAQARGDAATTNCIGSDCAQWRWSATDYSGSKVIEVETGERIGYCGMAGKP